MLESETGVHETTQYQCASVLARRFIQRWDLYAQQLDNGRYLCIHEPLTTQHLLAHLKGDITLGTYLLNKQDEARFVILDADDSHGFSRLTYLAERLGNESIPSYLEASRRGGHLWMFFRFPMPGVEARAYGLGVLTKHKIDQLEVFPKQSQLGDGPGSLIRLPLGIHRKSGKRYAFYDSSGRPLGDSVTQQILALQHVKPVPKFAIEKYIKTIPRIYEKRIAPPTPAPTETLADRIKGSVRVIDFLVNYIEITPTASGAVGLCPFHDDHHPSLGVNEAGNYWHCFAGCGGGSIIDFWMKWRGLDFEEALSELAIRFHIDPKT